jgi:hypothetical protein
VQIMKVVMKVEDVLESYHIMIALLIYVSNDFCARV